MRVVKRETGSHDAVRLDRDGFFWPGKKGQSAEHFRAGDWLLTDAFGIQTVVSEETFKKYYVEVV
jgi:hypothetical protein